ncbi:disulfide bond formation protein B [Iamia majanohamensis]|uniref:Disulfide bond formation protein B n=1 Tax=Iamia majanohamensis TaxID=467976 RepID=A0AAE9Y5E9_9ACTN|nr:disulfide bond formation protein B [Iamia majanohamensis]WCO66859.1 disulfide bond formation protein B [Iamia majanohamensis]
MTPDQVTTVFAVLAIAGSVLVVALLVGAALPSTRGPLRDRMAGQGLPLAWLVATVATLGSLYLSEVAHFPPCRLCWYQRIAMYPLVVVLGVGWFVRDRSPRITGLVLAGLGLAVNLWHVAVEIRPTLEGGSCDPTNPCSLRWVEQLGFWTIPRMAGVAFALVITALALDRGPAPAGPAPTVPTDAGRLQEV